MPDHPTICLIDDDSVLHFLVENLVKINHYSLDMIGFKNGKEGIDYLTSYSNEPDKIPDIIILDINMPIMDGWDFLDEYKKIKNTLSKNPAINIMSSSNRPEDKEKARSYEDVNGYFEKPIDEEIMKKMIK